MEKQLIYFMFLTLTTGHCFFLTTAMCLQSLCYDLSQDLRIKPFISHRHLFSLTATLSYFSHFYHENTLSYNLLFRTDVAGTAGCLKQRHRASLLLWPSKAGLQLLYMLSEVN